MDGPSIYTVVLVELKHCTSDRYIPTVQVLWLFGLPSPGSIDLLFQLMHVTTVLCIAI